MDQLRQLYLQIRYNLGEKGSPDTLDQQSFLNMIMVAIRQGRIPLVWKYFDFNKFTQISLNFAIEPMGAGRGIPSNQKSIGN